MDIFFVNGPDFVSGYLETCLKHFIIPYINYICIFCICGFWIRFWMSCKFNVTVSFHQMVDPVCHQLFEFYRSGRQELQRFTLQLVPTLVWAYLNAISKTEKRVSINNSSYELRPDLLFVGLRHTANVSNGRSERKSWYDDINRHIIIFWFGVTFTSGHFLTN